MQDEATKLLHADAAELAVADRVIAELGASPGDDDRLYHYILNHGLSALEIHRDKPTPRLWRARRLTVLQALSGDEDGTGNPRLSLYTFDGRPRDRDDLALLAECLAPRGANLRGYAVTEAADLLPSASRGREIPGPIAELDLGTLVIRDTQSLCLHDRDLLFSVLRAVAGDGQLSRRARKAAAEDTPLTRFPARCALHLSGNPGESRWRSSLPPLRGARSSEVLNDEADHLAAQRARGLGLPLSLLLLLDVPINLDEDEDIMTEVMDELMEEPRPSRAPRVREAALRETRVLVARLRDRFARVDLAPVASSLRRAESDLLLLLRDCVPQKDARTPREPGLDAETQLDPMMHSLRKLVTAAARAGGRGEAAPEDVGVAWRMMLLKLEVLRWVCGDHAVRKLPPRALVLRQAHERRRQRWEQLLGRSGGQPRTAAEVAEALGCPLHVARRELRERGLEPHGGRYDLPTASPTLAATRSRNEADLLALGFGTAAPLSSAPSSPSSIDEGAGPTERSEALFCEDRERRAEVGVIPIMGNEDPPMDGTTSEYDVDERRGPDVYRQWAEVLPAPEDSDPPPQALGPLPEVPLALEPLIDRWTSLAPEAQRRLGQGLLGAACAGDMAILAGLPGMEGELGKQLSAELTRRERFGREQAPALLLLALFAETPFAGALTLLQEAPGADGRLASAAAAIAQRLQGYQGMRR